MEGGYRYVDEFYLDEALMDAGAYLLTVKCVPAAASITVYGETNGHVNGVDLSGNAERVRLPFTGRRIRVNYSPAVQSYRMFQGARQIALQATHKGSASAHLS